MIFNLVEFEQIQMRHMLIYRVSQKTWEFSENCISSLLWISIVIPNFKSHNIIMSARVYLMKMVKDCKDVSNVSARWTVKTDKFTLFVFCNFIVLLSTPVCSQNINKQNVNPADETLTNYSFLSRYHHTKSKNYLKRRYRIRHWIPMFFGTPCIRTNNLILKVLYHQVAKI